jgi:putative pyruvate formate lyase activating enzyme
MRPCRLCEVRCGVDRLAGERGPCGVGRQARVYNAFVHIGEEPELSPCLAVFLTGCNFRCAFCSDGAEVDDPGLGVPLDPQALAERARGLRTVEFVGGLPDVNLLSVAQCAQALPADMQIALNTNGWFTPEALEAMQGWVHWLVPDLKFGPGNCARELAEIPDYWSILTRNLLLATAGPFRLLVRHLLMPGHLQCCTRPALGWLAERLPDTRVNLMTGYRPLHRALGRKDGLGRRLRSDELDEVLGWAETQALPRLSVDGRPSRAASRAV